MYEDVTTIKPVSKDMLYMKVADAIHSYIHNNKLQPGDKIPSERVLASQFQTGRNSVREALRVLENEGIIEVKTGRGAFVASNSSSSSIYLKLVKVNYIELLEIKLALEKYVLELVIKKITSEEIIKLEAILSTMENEADRGIYSGIEDQKFHKYLLHIAANKTLEQMLTKMIDVLHDYSQVVENANEMWLSTIPFHRELVNAIKNKDCVAMFTAHCKIREIDIIALNTIQSEINE